ncbi:MAG: ComEA family DNA-binding protein [Bernardetiaceae bacterium]
MLRFAFFSFILLFYLPYLSAQEPKREADFDLLIENLFQVQSEDLDYTDLYESLFQYFVQPIDLNTTEPAALQSLFILSDEQIREFFDYRNKYGNLLSIFELQAIPGFDPPTIQKLLPFVKVREQGTQADNRSVLARILHEPNTFFLMRYSRTLQRRRGYTLTDSSQSRYLGDPNQLYFRFRTAHTNDFSIGLTVEKDAGEQLIWDPSTRRYGADFWSAHAVLYNQKRFKTIAVGDYQLQVGQGLLLASGFNVGKGAETINTVRRTTIGIRPYTSVIESNFFRGAALTYELTPALHATGFYSRTRKDAKISTLFDSLTSDLEFTDFVSSIRETGYHRTPTEIATKGQVVQQDFGGHLEFRQFKNDLQIGLTFIGTTRDFPLRRNPSNYNQYEFSGTINHNIGANFNYNWQNFTFFGEAARSRSGGMGGVGGFSAGLSDKVDVAMLFRHYDRDFHTFYGVAFGEGSRNINETGLYWGIKFAPNRQWVLTAYYDKFRFPWLRFRTDAPSEGHEFLAQLMHSPSRRVSMYGRFRQESRAENIRREDQNMNEVLPYIRRNYLFNIDYKAEKIITLRARVQFSTFKHGENPQTAGYAIIQDAYFDWGKFRFSTRFAIFDTDDFQNRQYAYEKDVLYVFLIPALNGRGYRNYYLVQFRPHRRWDIWIKYSYTRYRNQDRISSGLETISGNLRSDIRLQVRYRLQ